MLVNLRALFGVFVDILLLRRGPEHLPASPALFAILVVLNFVLSSIAEELILPAPGPEAPTNWLVRIALFIIILLWFRVAFQLARKPERYVQTMIAMFGVNILTLPTMPLFAALVPYAMQKPGGEPAPGLLVLAAALVWFWLLAVMVRIVKSAFEWPWAGAVVFVVTSSFGILILLGLLFGESPKPS
jgi:hypothetical protein